MSIIQGVHIVSVPLYKTHLSCKKHIHCCNYNV